MPYIIIISVFSWFFEAQPPVTITGPSTAEVICLSEEEKKLFDLLNDYRKTKKLSPIPYSAKLTQVAQAHVKDLHQYYEFDPGGDCNPHSWSDQGEWKPCCYTNDHQDPDCMWDKPREIAGYEGKGYEIAYWTSGTANAVEGMVGWKKSPSHNPLIINKGIWEKMNWQAMGVGLYGNYGVVWFGLAADPSEVRICE